MSRRDLPDLTISTGLTLPGSSTIQIPVPTVAPLGVHITSTDSVQEVWDAFVKPTQDAGEPQSAEMRALMAILRAVYAGLEVW